MNFIKMTSIAAASLLCIACSTQKTASNNAEPAAQSKPASAPATQSKPAAGTSSAQGKTSADGARVVKSRDGKYEGEISGTPRRGSKFSKLEIGMQMNEIQDVMGRAPDRTHVYESGKRWIPFYFGNDATRMQVLYKGEGCLIVTGGNVWGGAGGELIRIDHDAAGACYQP